MIELNLTQHRQKIDQLRQSTSLSPLQAAQLEQSIVSSWQRSSSAAIPKNRLAAPLTDIKKISTTSTLNHALQHCAENLRHIAEQSSMVLAVSDIGSTVLWAATCPELHKTAENVHLVEGGQWAEEHVGTNALALSAKTQQSSCVFSSEHYMPSIQDMACYAAPIHDPYSKHILGVIALSTNWQKHNSLGLLAAERCASIIQSALMESQRQHLYIRAFAVPQVIFNGKTLPITPRQTEILAILALCPQGLSLESLHQALYGERKVSMGTLKAEMSQLRDMLGGMLGSRPYRLLAHVEADFLQTEQSLDAGYIDSALRLYTGIFLSKTQSPFLCAWRTCLESRLSDAIFKANQTDSLLKHVARFPEAIEAVERLIQLMPEHHPVHQTLLKLQDH